MTKSELLNIVDQLANKFHGAGVSNPVSYIEQISFLFFLKMLEEWDNESAQASRLSGKKFNSIFMGEKEKFRWTNWSQTPNNEKMFKFVRDEVLEFMVNLHGHEDVQRFFRGVRFMIPDPITLREVVDIVSLINFTQIDTDVKGDAYEHLVSKLATSGRNGMFRTPRHIIRTMVQLVDPKLGQTILDPACGTAGFLLAAFEHVKAQNSDKPVKSLAENGSEYLTGHGDNLSEKDWEKLQKETFWGFDVSPDITKIALMNMVLHGLDASNVYRRDSLAGVSDKFESMSFDVILANPPFSGAIAIERLRQVLPIKANDTTSLFLGLMVDSLKLGGTCGVIVNEGLLFSKNKTSLEIRKYILEKTELEAVISLPQGVFNPYAGVKTSFIIFRNTGKTTKKVWFYDVMHDGYSNGTQRRPLPTENDLPDLLSKWASKPNSDKSWTVYQKEIIMNDYVLAASVYRPAAISTQKKHRTVKKIFNEIEKLDKELITQKNKVLILNK